MSVSVICVAGESWIDSIIRSVEKHQKPITPSPLATHVAFLFGNEGVEAAFPRVRTFKRDDYDGAEVREYSLNHLPAAKKIRLILEAERYVGERYDLLGAWLAGFYAVTGRADKFFGNPSARIMCSEMFTECMSAIDIKPFGDLPSWDVTPAKVEEALIKGL